MVWSGSVTMEGGQESVREPELEITRALIEQYGRPFVQGDILFREGEPAAQAFLIHQGRVRLLKRVRMVERSVSVLRTGDLFGEGALVDGAVRPSTAVALSDGIMLALDRAALRTVVERFPPLSERILSQLVRRLRDAEDQIEVLMLRDTQSKVVSALLKMAQARGPVAEGAGPVELVLSPVELSALGVLVPALGSCVLGLAVLHGGLDAAAAYRLAVLDELFQEERWGLDWEAEERREKLAADLTLAARLARLSVG